MRSLDALDLKLMHDIHVWGHKQYRCLAFYFLLRLLALLLRQSRFYFGSFGIIGLAIGRTKSRGGEVTVGFFRDFL